MDAKKFNRFVFDLLNAEQSATEMVDQLEAKVDRTHSDEKALSHWLNIRSKLRDVINEA
jgi:hypothetical protein